MINVIVTFGNPDELKAGLDKIGDDYVVNSFQIVPLSGDTILVSFLGKTKEA
jgi:hypothetical protein